MNPTLPISQRRLDVFFAIMLLLFAATSFGMDAFGAMGIDWAHTRHPLGPTLVEFGKTVDRVYLMTDSPWVRMILGFSGFVFGPLKLVLAVGLLKDWRWVRGPGLALMGAYLYSTLVYTAVALWGPAPSLAPITLLAVTSPYAVIPAWLIVHLSRKVNAPT